jgi:quercetin dioxygenase-like cupin family protein
MTPFHTWTRLVVSIAWMATAQSPTVVARMACDTAPDKAAEQARIAFAHALPNLDGSNLSAAIVEVTYGPGGSSPPHSHPCAVIGYVIEGALRSQMKGEAEAIYKAGETFYEAPNGVHMISANASSQDPVRFLATFVCDRDTPLTVRPPQTAPL